MINGHNHSEFWMQPFTWRLRWAWIFKNSQLSTARGMQLEESWRRTYWILFITDQHFAIVRNMPIFGLRDAITTVEPPCEESDYQSGNISQLTTFRQYDARESADVEIIYSSFTYLIDAVRTVTFILRNVTEIGEFSEELFLAAANLQKGSARNGWEGRRTLITIHLIVCIAGITLHQTFSSLTYSVEELYPETFPPAPINAILPPKQSGWSSHTVKAFKATENQTELLALPSQPILHSPMATSITAGITTAQVAACKVFLDGRPLAVARDHIHLSTGILTAYAEIRPLARKMLREVKLIARPTLSAPQTNQPQYPGPPEIETPQDEFYWKIDPAPHMDI